MSSTPRSVFRRGSRLAYFALLGLLISGCATSQPSRLNMVEKAMWSTCPLITSTGMATGFVVRRHPPHATGTAATAVVTANHLLETVGKNALAIGSRRVSATGEPELEVFELQSGDRRHRFYVRHPVYDLAAFAFDIPAQYAKVVRLPTYLDVNSIAARSGLPRPGTDVFFLGYPETLPGTSGAFPILRRGTVASYALGSAKSEGYFLIDADVYPGDSGAPVFAGGLRGRPQLLGVILRRLATNEHAPSHLAIAISAEAVRETLQLLEMGRSSQVRQRGSPATKGQ